MRNASVLPRDAKEKVGGVELSEVVLQEVVLVAKVRIQ